MADALTRRLDCFVARRFL